MSDNLVMRVYNVRFGDALLITVPDKDPSEGTTTKRRILIDVGNAPTVASPEGGDDSVFKPVIDDILAELDGDPIDLYVMTHEHLDHVQGLPHAAWKLYPNDFEDRLRIDYVWMTASAEDDYYDRHPNSKEKKLAFDQSFGQIQRFLKMKGTSSARGFVEILGVNNPQWTKPCVDYLQTLAPNNTTYVYRGVDLANAHPFREATFSIWAPEEDTSEYYGRLLPVDTGEPAEPTSGAPAPSVTPMPPPGVDMGAFLNLVERRRLGIADNLLAIDKAKNNTSVVFLMEWRGWRFLFAGDAEEKSWRMMNKAGVLQPVHVLKVSHHGSHNGTPDGDIFSAVLPEAPPPDRDRHAVISTWTETYPGIPHPPTDAKLASRCTLHTNLQDKDSLYYDLVFPA